MGFSVTEFKENVGGIAPVNRFYVDFGGIAIGIFEEFFPKQSQHFLIKEASIPSMEIKTATVNFWGYDRDIASSGAYDTLSLTMLCDADMKIRKAFEKWIDMVYNKEFGTVHYYDSYVADVNVHVLNRALQEVRIYQYIEAYPRNLSDIVLNYDDSDTPMTFTVTFEYWDWFALAPSNSK
jgi:hypothetical protein